jgi:hypothetical protein
MKRYAQDEEAQKVFDEQVLEIELCGKYSQWYGSAFFVMQKRD